MPFTPNNIFHAIKQTNSYLRDGIGITLLTTYILISHGQRKTFINTE